MNQSVTTLVISNQFRQKYLATSAIIILVFGFVYIILNTSSNHPLLMSSQEKPFPETFEPFFEPLKITQKIIRSNSRVIKASEFNLLEDTELELSSLEMCTLEWMNLNRLQQNHPCVIETIRRRYLHPPADPDVPYVLQAPNASDPSAGQAKSILKYLANQTEGFFIECGALDGEHLSNTLYMERTMQWSGILVEADQTSFGKLLSRRRKSYALPVCLSLEPYPTQVTFKIAYAVGSIQEPADYVQGKKSKKTNQGEKDKGGNSNIITLQCFPLYSILLAVGRTKVDFFSLDVEGHELKILKTIPWHKVDIKTLTVEWDHVGQQPLIDYMEPKGYYVFGRNEGTTVGADIFFARNDSFHLIH